MSFLKVGNDWINLQAITRIREITRKTEKLPQLQVYFNDKNLPTDVTDTQEIEIILDFLGKTDANAKPKKTMAESPPVEPKTPQK